MVAPYESWFLADHLSEVTQLISQGIGIGVVIVFSMSLIGFVINKIIKIGMGNV